MSKKPNQRKGIELNISKMKKDLEKYNPYNKEKIIFISNRTNPNSYRKYKTIYDEYNSKKEIDITEKTININLLKKIIKEKEKENKEFKVRIIELEKELKKQREKYKNKIILLKSEAKKKSKFKSNEIPINNISNINNDNNIIFNLNQKIQKYKNKINTLSDENLNLLNEKKNMKNKILSLIKDKQFLIEQIAELNKSLNNKIKPKLNENENDLINLNNQIMEVKNKNNILIKENISQKEIINDLKEELSDIYHKTSLICKNNYILQNSIYNNFVKNNFYTEENSKKYISMKSLKGNNKNNFYEFKNKLNSANKKDQQYNKIKQRNRINTDIGIQNNHPFYKIKDPLSYNKGLSKKNTDNNNNISNIIDNLLNTNQKENNNVRKYNSNTANNKTFNTQQDLNKNKELYINVKKNYNIINTSTNKNILSHRKNNKSNLHNFPYSSIFTQKFKNINKLENEEDINFEITKRDEISSNKSFLSDYIYEDNNDLSNDKI